MEKVKEGKEPESGFKTYCGVAHTTQEMVANAIGIVKFDFPFFKNLKKLDDFLSVDEGLFHKQRQKLADLAHPNIMFLWQKTGLQKAVLKWTREAEQPNIDGLSVREEGKWKRLSSMGVIDEVYLEKYRQSLEENAGFRKFSQGVEMIGVAFELVDCILETAEMIAAFNEAWVAWARMGQELGKVSRDIREFGSQWEGIDTPWKHHGHGFFSRGDLALLENLKMTADNSASSAQDAGWKWFLKMAPQALGFCECGELFKEVKSLEKAQTAYGAAKKFATTVDKLTHANVVDIYETQIANKWHDLNASTANDSALMYHGIGMSTQYGNQQAIALQFYVRAKVLYGLKRLIDLCGPLGKEGDRQRRVSKYNFIQSWTTPGKTFEQAVAELRVNEYITELCLARSFWVRKDHLLADWLHHWMQEKDPTHKDQILRTKEPTEDQDRWFKVDFQRYWPIHYRDIPTVEKFAAQFSTDFSSVDDSDVQTCFLQKGTSSWAVVPGTSDGSKMLRIAKWELLLDKDVIDSETPVRAILVFKKDAPVRAGLPVTFQLERTDLLNVPGPVYQTIARPLATPGAVETGHLEKDPELGKYKDQMGAIVSFSYSYAWKRNGNELPAKIYYGLKPMIEDPSWKDAISTLGFKYVYQWARNAHEWLVPCNMTFAVKYNAGDGHVDGYAHTRNGFWNSTVEVTVQPDHISGPQDPEFNQRNHAKFTDLDFLRRQLPESPPPKPKYPGLENVLVQYLDGEKWLPVNGDQGVAFRTPVRIIFVSNPR